MDLTELRNERMLKFNSELLEDLKLNEMNIRDKTLTACSIKTKWIRILFEEKRLLKRLIEYRKTKTEEYIRSFGKDLPENVRRIKGEAEAKKNSEILKIESAIDGENEVVEYLEQMIKVVLAGFSYDIKNSIDIMKIENS